MKTICVLFLTLVAVQARGPGGRGGRGFWKRTSILCSGTTDPTVETQIQACRTGNPPYNANVTAKIDNLLNGRANYCANGVPVIPIGPHGPPRWGHHGGWSSGGQSNENSSSHSHEVPPGGPHGMGPPGGPHGMPPGGRRGPWPTPSPARIEQWTEFRAFMKCISAIQTTTTSTTTTPVPPPPARR